MSLRALLYAYLLGGLTFVPLVLFVALFVAVYTSVPAPVPDAHKNPNPEPPKGLAESTSESSLDSNDFPRTRRGWLTVRHSFEESAGDGSYVTLVKSYLDARSKDPKRSRPKDMWYVVLKGKVMYLYDDEGMSDCEVAVELGSHDVVIYPEGLLDGELFTRRNAICLKPRARAAECLSPVAPKEVDAEQNDKSADQDQAGKQDAEEPVAAPWFIFVRCCDEMEDWYMALVHASDHPPGTPTLNPLKPVFLPTEMSWLVSTLDEQPDVIPMRWFNALLGRVFYSFYRTQMLESYIIGRIMKKLSKVKRPAFLSDVAVTQFSVGNKPPMLSKPMLKELTKEGDASLEVSLAYKGAIRATVEATAVINLGARFKSYTVKLVLAVVIRELEGNLLVKVKRPPSSRIWYAFTKPPRMVINVEPIVSDRQITWTMITSTIEAKIEEIIADSVVLPNMDDISFFDSDRYDHRGGVWADAARSDKLMTPPTPEATPKPCAHDDTGSFTLARVRTEPDPDSIPPATTSEKTPIPTRRRSWFSSNADAEFDCELTRQAEEEAKTERPTELDGILAPLLDTPQPLDVSDHEQEAPECLAPHPSFTPPQPHSRTSRAHSVSSSTGGDDSVNYLSDTSTTSKGPRHTLTTTTASSFLSTLKSKAGDKQALSNTAKEAMRKWGVNWGLKKDQGGNPPLDDLPEVGPSDRRVRTESTRGRQNYADMHASALERPEPSEGVNGVSSPISIPQGGGGEKGRSTSVSGGRMTSTSFAGESASSGLSRSLGEVSSDPFKDRDFTEMAEDNPAPSLIHTQPSQARTMTIPGIHVSHRGDVMSMGNVAPDPPVPDNRPKGATIQNMYRLWKSPILTGQPSQGSSASTTSSPGRSEADDGDHDVAPLSLTPDIVSPTSRPVPPPLPPRAVSSVAVKHAGETMDVSSSVSSASQALKMIATKDETRRVSVEINNPSGGEPTQPAGGPDTTSTAVPTASPSGKPPLPPRRNAA